MSSLFKDIKCLVALVLASALLALAIDQSRPRPLGFAYTTPAQQMNVARTALFPNPKVAEMPIIDLETVAHAVRSHNRLIVDARPELFWKMGHIPGAINLPHKYFDEYYPRLEPVLRNAEAAGRRLLLYCADVYCSDAGKLAKSLTERGFDDVEVFEGGWAVWQQSGQKLETN